MTRLNPQQRPLFVKGMIPIFLIGAIVLLAGAGEQGQKPMKTPASPGEILDQLLKLTPAERLSRLSKVLDQDKDFLAVDRGPVTFTIVERGSLHAVEASEVICRVRALNKDTRYSVIKWVVEEGNAVKKGEKLIEFDDSAHKDQLREQKILVAKADADQQAALKILKQMQKENTIDINIAKIDVRLAELAREQYKGNDNIQKQVLDLQVDRNLLLLERLKLKLGSKESQAEAAWKVKKNIHERERDRQLELEKDLANHVEMAPQDGVVVYYFNPESRSAGHGFLVAQGEPVREGQKLLWISDLKRMSVHVRVSETLIAKVRVGQKVRVRVDAYPKRALTGKVQDVSKTADHEAFFSSNVKVYPVTIVVDGVNPGLKPGMSGEATILVEERPKCLRVPTTSILSQGKEKFCYVLKDKELHIRKLNTGLVGTPLSEITNGLKEGEKVLRSPSEIVGRLADFLRLERKKSGKGF